MGKRKESSTTGTEDDPFSITESPGSAHKKHKKHKKKHKRKRDSDECYSDFSVLASPNKPGSLKLKLRIGGETLATKDVLPPYDNEEAGEAIINVIDENSGNEGDVPVDPALVPTKPTKTESDEEERWLDALEKGELNDYGEIQKKAKDPSLLTARQRALLHGKQEHELLQLPSGYKTTELTEEQVLKRQQRAKKRRQQAHEKREKDKKQILDRLLKKQETKSKGSRTKGAKRLNLPRVRYLSSRSGTTISMPPGYSFPFAAEKAEPPKSPGMCGVSGCRNPKKYNCSKTSVPLCSLQCYKQNLQQSKAFVLSVT